MQASAAGAAIALGGAIRDLVSDFAIRGALGSTLAVPSTGYGFVYTIEIVSLFITLAAIGPLVKTTPTLKLASVTRFGLAEFPG